jgi:adenylate kinase family enzyme
MLAKQGANVDKVLNFAIDDTILEERITGRWIHPASGRTYHTKFAPPKTQGVDDVSKTQSPCLATVIFAQSYFYVFLLFLLAMA